MTTPFNLEAAKRGAPVQTRSGSPARIICFDAAGPEPLVVLLRQDDPEMGSFGYEEPWAYSAAGAFEDGRSGSLDLVMA